MEWSKEQQKVIDLRNRNILVSAAAGSGKTAVLVERIIQMITDEKHPVDIDHLLVVTFTNAAAGEMRERIAQAIEKRLENDKENLHLQKQMSLIHNAQITTLHSFCLYLIRNYFNQIDLDPGFVIADEAENKMMKADVLKEILEEHYEKEEESFIDFVESYATGKSDTGLEDMILRLYEFSMSHPTPKQWLKSMQKMFFVEDEKDILQADWMQELMNYIKSMLASLKIYQKEAMELITSGNGPYMYEKVMKADMENLRALCKCEDYLAMQKTLKEITWNRLPSKKDETVDPDKREYVKGLRDRVKGQVQDIENQFFFQPFEKSIEDLKKVRVAMKELVDLTLEFKERFEEAKREKNRLDFNDLEHLALKILLADGEPSPVALELQEFFEEILVDEYQDSNLVQETITKTISKENSGHPNRFMVGDVKQSIYKFRLASPKIFVEKYNSYDFEDSLYQRIDLDKNFRSRAMVLESVNRIFERIMHRSLGDVEYDTHAALHPAAVFPPFIKENVDESGETEGICGGKTEILLLDGKEEALEDLTKAEQEAFVIAQKIKQLKKEKFHVLDKKTKKYRPFEYRDIVILLRGTAGWAEGMLATFEELGIPAYADSSVGYFSAREVQVILNFLKVLDNPRQDIPLASVLFSEIGGFTEEELAKLRIQKKQGLLYECLLTAKDTEDSENDMPGKERDFSENKAINWNEEKELQKKVVKFLNELEYYRSKLPYTSVSQLLMEIYERTGYYDFVTLLPAGETRKGNLDMLLEKAKAFEKSSYTGLFQFNRYMEKLHSYDIDYGEAGNQDEKNAVCLMTIHKSKGLEFPIVFVGAMGKKFNQTDSRSRLVFHPELGIGPDYIDYKERIKTPTLLKKVIQRTVTMENLAEELRILYVALTRAKEKLILIGRVDGLEKKMEQWYGNTNMTFERIASAQNYMDWVMPCAIQCPEEFSIEELSAEEIVTGEVEHQISRLEKWKQLSEWNGNMFLSDEEKQKMDALVENEYSFKNEQEIHSKMSVSDLKHQAYEELHEAVEDLYETDRKEAYVPKFYKEQEALTGTSRGNLYHMIMEHLVLAENMTEEQFCMQLDVLMESGRLTKEEREAVNKKKFLEFMEKPIAKRMLKAEKEGKLFREQPFVLGIPAYEIYPGNESKELVIVQGIIDAFFEEEGEIVLLDYKTDRIRDEKQLIDRYRKQMELYQRAITTITGKNVKETILYSFSLGKEIYL